MAWREPYTGPVQRDPQEKRRAIPMSLTRALSGRCMQCLSYALEQDPGRDTHFHIGKLTDLAEAVEEIGGPPITQTSCCTHRSLP